MAARDPSLTCAAGLAGLLALTGCFHDAPPTLSGTSGGSSGSTSATVTTAASTTGLTTDGAATTGASTWAGTTGAVDPTTGASTGMPATATTTTTAPDMGSRPPVCPQSPDLVACYAFEDGWDTLTLVDDSANSLDGTLEGATQVDGRRGFGAATSAASKLAVPGAPELASGLNWSVAAWIRLEAVGPSRVGILDRDGDYGIFVLGDGRPSCGDANQPLVGPTNLSLRTWHHIACVREDSGMQLFVDGVLEAEGVKLVNRPAPIPTLVLANDSPPSAAEALVGVLDEVMLWRRTLTPAEVCSAAGLDC